MHIAKLGKVSTGDNEVKVMMKDALSGFELTVDCLRSQK